ncbi:MBL fold metallo-hydrolase [Amycolatopsis minnesotensis]|uniref:MBL fold metallo-hydrolase n=1 Tax=Amycolatopsis minnesotensis TaxID=337894 RepID=A0ABP5C066_9PSEU
MRYPRSLYRVFERVRKPAEARVWPASFADRLTSGVPTNAEVRRLWRELGTRAPDRHCPDLIPTEAGARVPAAGSGEVSVTWVGHSTCVLRIGGLVVLTDPVFSRRIPGLSPRLTRPGVAFEDLPPVDAVVISHNHFDHLDAPTIRRLPRSTTLLVPGGLGWWFRRLGFRDVAEFDWWESLELGRTRFTFTPTHHWSRRTLFDTNRSLWGGWVLSTGEPGGTVFFGGDSAYGPVFTEIGARCPGIDLAMLPVGAFLPRWFMRQSHMDPAESVRACVDLGAAHFLPIHWGTFMQSAEPLLSPLHDARRAWRKAKQPPERFLGLAVGGSHVLGGSAEPVDHVCAEEPAKPTN